LTLQVVVMDMVMDMVTVMVVMVIIKKLSDLKKV
jgi:hypothetical protein